MASADLAGLDCVRPKVGQFQESTGKPAAVGVRVGTHAQVIARQPVHDLRLRGAAVVEELAGRYDVIQE